MDISELKRTEDALKAKQDLLRSLINVQENEKQKLCYEFHDGLIQYAVGALMSLDGFQNNHAPSEATATIEAAINHLRTASKTAGVRYVGFGPLYSTVPTYPLRSMI